LAPGPAIFTVDENNVVKVEVAVAHADLALGSPLVEHIFERGDGRGGRTI
jgi:hypothetical protein